MIAWLGAVLAASLLGSLHCAGMCGGFVGCLAGDRNGAALPLHGAYHLGRLSGYLTLGAVAGAIGAGIERSGAVAGLHGIAPYLCGGLIVAFALVSGARALGLRVPLPAPPSGPARGVGRILATLRERGPIVRGGALGLLTAGLPCGWLYAFVATAAGTGSLLGGVATMAAFWLGTVPILLGLGLGAGRLWAPVRARLPLVSACLLLVLGLGTILGRGPLPAAPSPVAAAEGANESADADALHSETLRPDIPTEAPCCNDE